MENGQILIINKPKGLTSHDVVDLVRKKLGVRKVGHAGTLDPGATGVLIILVGKKTKEQAKYMGMEKEYVAEVEFGMATETGDRDGRLIAKLPNWFRKSEISFGKQIVKLRRKEIEDVLPKFIGRVKQKVPLYSAVKVKGKKLYQLARKGERPRELPEREVEIKEIKILDFKKGTDKTYPVVKLKVTCGKGVYIRQLAVDLGKALGVPAYLKSLVRTRVGKFGIKKAIAVDFDLGSSGLPGQKFDKSDFFVGCEKRKINSKIESGEKRSFY